MSTISPASSYKVPRHQQGKKEWSKELTTVLSVFGRNSAGQLPVSSVTPPATNLALPSTCFSSLPMNHHRHILEHYWNVEQIATKPTQKDILSTHDKKTLQILRDTCRHNGERYETGLPWKRNSPLPNNYFAALSHLRSLGKRFREHPQKKVKFDETL